MFTLPLGIGQIHAMHELFKINPRLAALVLLLIMGIAIYYKFYLYAENNFLKKLLPTGNLSPKS